MINTCPIYKKAHYFLQVGTKHVISMELQIFNCKDGKVWFGDQQLSVVIRNVQGELMARIDRKDNDMDVQIIEEDSLLMVYKFRPTGGTDSVILHKSQMEAAGLTSRVQSYGDGDYTYLILFREKLIISVSLIDQCEELLNLTEADVEDMASNYFNNLKKATNSEKRKKDTLKKIWSTRNRLNVRKDISRVCEGTSSDQHLTTDGEENNVSEDKVISFKEKISVYGHDKRKDIEIREEIPEQPKQCIEPNSKVVRKSKHELASELSSEKELSTSHRITSYYDAASGMLVDDVPDSVSTASCCSNIQMGSELQNDVNSSVIVISQSIPDHEEGKAVCKQTTKCEDNKEIEEGFSDNDDFSTPKVKKKRRKRHLYYNSGIKKRKKCNVSTSPSHNKKTRDKLQAGDDPSESIETNDDNSIQSPLESITLSSQNANNDKMSDDDNDVPMKTISMEDLIRAKDADDPSQPMEEIDTLIADKTIDLDEYGKVTLEDVHSSNDLSVEQVRELVREMEVELRNIFKGKTKCERHTLFKKGGNEKGSLNMRVAFGLFSEQQEDAITNTLVEMFCTKKTKYFDYTMKVLLPETMAMLYAKIAKISHEEADKLIMERC